MEVDDDSDEEDEELSLVDIRARVLAAGFTEAQLMETIVNVSLTFPVPFPKTDQSFSSTKTSISGCGWQTMRNCVSRTISVSLRLCLAPHMPLLACSALLCSHYSLYCINKSLATIDITESTIIQIFPFAMN